VHVRHAMANVIESEIDWLSKRVYLTRLVLPWQWQSAAQDVELNEKRSIVDRIDNRLGYVQSVITFYFPACLQGMVPVGVTVFEEWVARPMCHRDWNRLCIMTKSNVEWPSYCKQGEWMNNRSGRRAAYYCGQILDHNRGLAGEGHCWRMAITSPV